MRLLISGGGTAGHVYPALAVAKALQSDERFARLDDNSRGILYVGGSGSLEQDIVSRGGLKFQGIPVRGGLRGLSPVRALANGLALVRAFGQCRRLIGAFRPNAILATGGYVCAPVVAAGWLAGVPSLVYLPDLSPGWTIRSLVPLARRAAVSFAEARRYFPSGRVVVTGYPVRPDLFQSDKRGAREFWNLTPDLPALLVVGGSRGAHSINVAVGEALPELVELGQIIHVSGPRDEAWLQERRKALPPGQRERYRLYAYLYEEMPQALVACDLAVSRAGASVLGEYPAAGLPSVLVPYIGGHRDQERNAEYLARAGAAVVLPDTGLSGPRLHATVARLLDDPVALAEMARRARLLAQPRAAQNIVDELWKIST
ncbi:MAG: UDP-N-acetylglucosamine--N-acetylmuramyl-(pentapeptide) pyrophosphoryl-undecaprenol N-acetylglucosamine transferase [Chloroflexi bacterium]|nr:UDP-N-acetylglucosamine--N-acetylmuramyl-(pentapeptide) pyrophosphoryl-undecaprenol N-acetylglucosamine transferase [Chloroflexota bacterium]